VIPASSSRYLCDRHKCFLLTLSIELTYNSRDSAVGIATGYELDDRGVGVRVPVGARIFTSPCRPDRLWGPPKPPIQCVPGVLSPGVKRPGREADNSPSTSAEVKKTLIYTSTPPIRLHGVVLN
jgi:hypothetical protein